MISITFIIGVVVGWIINDYIDDIKAFVKNLF